MLAIVGQTRAGRRTGISEDCIWEKSNSYPFHINNSTVAPRERQRSDTQPKKTVRAAGPRATVLTSDIRLCIDRYRDFGRFNASTDARAILRQPMSERRTL